jgi:hypothetical protein
VPLIPTAWREVVFYVYDNARAARSSEKEGGGTGFFVSLQSQIVGKPFVYGVTNWHVISDCDKPTLRLNMVSRGWDTLETSKRSWIRHPTEDIAVIPIAELSDEYNVRFVNSEEWFVTPNDMDRFSYGAGDEVVMIGRLIGHDGKARNAPISRFGNISRNPIQEQPSFLVEMRSIGGHSGSPVFAIPSAIQMPGVRKEGAPRKLLGIDSGHHRELAKILHRTSAGEWKEVQDMRSFSNTSIATVIPAWKIAELLNIPKLQKQREKAEQAYHSLGAAAARAGR